MQLTSCCPSPFPNDFNYLVAPFWADIDIRGDDGGEIYYQVHSRGNNSVSDELLDEVSVFVSNNSQQTVFNGSWMLMAMWDQVKAFPGDSSSNVSFLTYRQIRSMLTNSYNVISLRSYSVYIHIMLHCRFHNALLLHAQYSMQQQYLIHRLEFQVYLLCHPIFLQ